MSDIEKTPDTAPEELLDSIRTIADENTAEAIHEAIADYEDAVFYDILAEELSRRDMDAESVPQEDMDELSRRMEEYYTEFEKNGIENIKVEI